MRQRIISLLLVLALCLGTTALAEERFTFRNGIHLGMTYEEIVSAEGREPDDMYDNILTYGSVNLCGLDGDTYLAYYLDCDGKLDTAVYCNEDNGIEMNEYMKGAISSVYGQCRSSTAKELSDALQDYYVWFADESDWHIMNVLRWDMGDIYVYYANYSRYESGENSRLVVVYVDSAKCGNNTSGLCDTSGL